MAAVRVAAVQFEPVYLNPEATMVKMTERVADARQRGAKLVVFPETACTMYCNWPSDPFQPAEGSLMSYYDKYAQAAIAVPGPETDMLAKVARENETIIVTGLVERDPAVRGILWNSSIVIDEQGRIVGRHRKLTPVVHEKIYYAPGSTEDIRIFATSAGRLGIGICFENMVPLYRRVLGQLGEEIHCALWSSPGFAKGVRTAGWDIEANRRMALARAHALDTGVFVLLAALVTTGNRPEGSRAEPTWIHTGGSYILNPAGQVLAEVPSYEEGIAVADIDLGEIATGRLYWNQFGKDDRPDLFSLQVRGLQAAS